MLTKCQECGREMSTSARACPQCGSRMHTTPLAAWLILGVVVIGGLWFVWVSTSAYIEAENRRLSPTTYEVLDRQ